MDKLEALCRLCKCGVYVSINEHRDYYQSVERYLDETFKREADEITESVYDRIIIEDTLIHIQFYPDTPSGFYRVFHYDLELALRDALEILTDE